MNKLPQTEGFAEALAFTLAYFAVVIGLIMSFIPKRNKEENK